MSNDDQIAYWNGAAGQRWAQEDDTMARLLHPVCEALLTHANIDDCTAAIDVGCGGGSQSVMLAAALQAGAKVLGVDISEPMLEVARGRAAPEDGASVEFLCADASTHTFAPDSFDLLFSRFGVMFFDDPVAAFSNMRGAMRSQGQLAFACWQPLKVNDWARIPVKAALQHVPAPEASDPHESGPFAFADPERVTAILTAAGFGDIAVQSYTPTLRISEAPTLAEAARGVAQIGPVGRLLVDQEPAVLEKVFTAMETALAPHYQPGALELPGAVWFVTARAA